MPARLTITHMDGFTRKEVMYVVYKDEDEDEVKYGVRIETYDAIEDQKKHDKDCAEYRKAKAAYALDKKGVKPVLPDMHQIPKDYDRIYFKNLAAVKQYLIQLHQWMVYDPESKQESVIDFNLEVNHKTVLHFNSIDNFNLEKYGFDNRQHLKDFIVRFCDVFDSVTADN